MGIPIVEVSLPIVVLNVSKGLQMVDWLSGTRAEYAELLDELSSRCDCNRRKVLESTFIRNRALAKNAISACGLTPSLFPRKPRAA